MGSVPWLRAAKGLSSWFPAWFQADSETHLLKQGEFVIGLPLDMRELGDYLLQIDLAGV